MKTSGYLLTIIICSGYSHTSITHALATRRQDLAEAVLSSSNSSNGTSARPSIYRKRHITIEGENYIRAKGERVWQLGVVGCEQAASSCCLEILAKRHGKQPTIPRHYTPWLVSRGLSSVCPTNQDTTCLRKREALQTL